MTTDQILVFTVLGCTLILFAWGRWRFDLVAVAALLVLTWLGIVPADRAFRGFGHPAVITVVAVLVISRSMRKSGIVRWFVAPMTALGKSAFAHVSALTALVAALSAFMNNVGALAFMMPVAIESARKAARSVSRVLMPLSFASLLGGLLTLIGTPPNIIIAAFREETTGTPFAMFDFTPVGAGVAVSGLAYIALVGWRLLPVRKAGNEGSDELFQIDDYVGEARVRANSAFLGKRISELEQAAEGNANVVGLIRNGRHIVASLGSRILREGDLLLLEGEPAFLKSVIDTAGLEIMADEPIEREALDSDAVALVEAVVSPNSHLEGRSPDRAGMRRRYGLNLLAVSRQGRSAWDRLESMRFRVGDVLLLRADTETIGDSLSRIGCWPLAERPIATERTRDAAITLVLFATAIVLAASGIVAIHIAFATVAALLVLARCLTLREAYEHIDWPIIILIGAMLPVGEALRHTGGTETLSNGLLAISGALPPLAILMIVMASAMWLSDIINNAAAAVIMAPLSISVADRLNANPDAFLMAIAIGASSTFLTPIGHQSNALVMGPGGYRFADYWRMGLPLDILVLAVGTGLIRVVWW